MSPEALRAAVKRLGLKKIKVTTSHFAKKNEHTSDLYLKIFSQAWPEAQYEQKPDLDPGVHPVPVEFKFVATDLYFRAIAKIAFHYYLTQSMRSLGNEDYFREIRDFIRYGGGKLAVDKFFIGSNIFSFPQFLSNMVPSWWHHILATLERDGTVFAMVCLFYGPECKGERYTLELGKIPGRIVLPKSCWAHTYDYFRPEDIGKYAGKVHPVSITALR